MENSRLISAALTLLALTGCANLRATAIRADISSQIAGDFTYMSGSTNYHGAHVGRLELDVPVVTTRQFSLNAFAVHESLVDTPHDRGEERAGLQLVYRPFARGGL